MIKIIPYAPQYRQAFYDINAEWISQMFILETVDEEVLKDPEGLILNEGGVIFFAKHPELGIVGTCALRKMASGEFELTKMGVLKKARGLKIGETLLKYVIQYVRGHKIPYCFLLTNKNCEAAIHLYEKNGFIHDASVMKKFGGSYDRCNVAMRLT